MKHKIAAISLLVTFSLAACTPLAGPTATQVGELEPTTVNTTNEEIEVRELIENFGKRLQMVSLLAPSAAEDVQTQYAEFVSPTLVETWMHDVTKAPGRRVSSPWPDRIEITTLERASPDRYVVDGFVIEITSTEVSSDEAANKMAVHIVVESDQGGWRITEYAEDQ